MTSNFGFAPIRAQFKRTLINKKIGFYNQKNMGTKVKNVAQIVAPSDQQLVNGDPIVRTRYTTDKFPNQSHPTYLFVLCSIADRMLFFV